MPSCAYSAHASLHFRKCCGGASQSAHAGLQACRNALDLSHLAVCNFLPCRCMPLRPRARLQLQHHGVPDLIPEAKHRTALTILLSQPNGGTAADHGGPRQSRQLHALMRAACAAAWHGAITCMRHTCCILPVQVHPLSITHHSRPLCTFHAHVIPPAMHSFIKASHSLVNFLTPSPSLQPFPFQ